MNSLELTQLLQSLTDLEDMQRCAMAALDNQQEDSGRRLLIIVAAKLSGLTEQLSDELADNPIKD